MTFYYFINRTLCNGTAPCGCDKIKPSGFYRYSTRSLRGGCTGWGDNSSIDPAFPLFKVRVNYEISVKDSRLPDMFILSHRHQKVTI